MLRVALIVSYISAFVDGSCTLDERVYWGADVNFANGIEQMFFGGIFGRPRLAGKVEIMGSIVDMAYIPFSSACASCIANAYFCYRTEEARFANPTSSFFGLVATRTPRDAIIGIEKVCMYPLIQCSGFAWPSLVPGIWRNLIRARIAHATEMRDIEFLEVFKARYGGADGNGDNPLLRAIKSGLKPHVVSCIAPMAEFYVRDRFGKTAIDYTVGKLDERVALSEFANRTQCWGEETFWFAAARLWTAAEFEKAYSDREHPPINAVDWYGNSALHIASESPHLGDGDARGLVEWIVERGGDIHQRGSGGNTALMLAVMRARSTTVSYLLSRGADVNAVNDDGMTALMFAASAPQDIIKMLVEKGANIDMGLSPGWTALTFAASYSDHESSVKNGKYLLSIGAHSSEVIPNAPVSEVLNRVRENISLAPLAGDTRRVQVAKFRLANNWSNVCLDWSGFVNRYHDDSELLFQSYNRCEGYMDDLACLAEKIRDDSSIGCIACFRQLASCPLRLLFESHNLSRFYSDGQMFKHFEDKCVAAALRKCTGSSDVLLPTGWSVYLQRFIWRWRWPRD